MQNLGDRLIMRVHIIQKGEVKNTIAIESIELAQQLFNDSICIEATEGGPGWIYQDGILSPEPEPAKTEQELIQEVTDATQARLDTFAKTRNYDGILSACTYATSSVPKFATEGQYCVTARDATWATLYGIMAAVTAGARPMPADFAAIEPELPTLQWPEA